MTAEVVVLETQRERDERVALIKRGRDELVEILNLDLAERLYKVTGNTSRLLELGIDPATVKRPPYRPSKTMFDDRQIVQLVWKQEYQAGVKFSNNEAREKNPCFLAVAKAQGRHVSAVIRQWRRVPAAERVKIREWLRERLREHGQLHERHKK